MGLNKIYSVALNGLECEIVEVEADSGMGACAFQLVGLADKSIEESRERIRSAIRNSGFRFPNSRVTVNLAPADLRKHGSLYDLSIAVGTLLSKGDFTSEINLKDSIFVGELSLSGEVKSIAGILPITISIKERGFKKIFLPSDNASEASVVEGIEVYPVKQLSELMYFIMGDNNIKPYKNNKDCSGYVPPDKSLFLQIKGQYNAKRALEICAASGSNLLMTGSPGAGKTLLARAMQVLLPKLELSEAIEVTKVYSISGLLKKNQSLIFQPPFRHPHHSSSAASIIGGGKFPKPGEISLANRGVLFLDELSEFPRIVLENLREPLEDGIVSVCRVSGSITYPARFILIAATNPCPCGYKLDPDKECICSRHQISSYSKKLSGPILDRIDLHIEVPKVKFEELFESNLNNEEEYLKNILKRIKTARQIQKQRLEKHGKLLNSEMPAKLVEQYCKLDIEGLNILKAAKAKLNFSARAYHRILKVSRTIADLDQSTEIKKDHLLEAIQYREKAEEEDY